MSTMNQTIIDALHFRYACKKFNPEKAIPQEEFQTILEAAHLSPSSFGFEPWKVVVLQDSALRQKLFPIAWGAQNSLRGASHFVLLLARKGTDTIYRSDYSTHIMRDVQMLPADMVEKKRAFFQNFQENEFRLLENDRAMFDWACKQTYIALANMLSAAALLGIDSCPIEGFSQNAVDRLLEQEGILDPEHFGVAVMAGFGYRDEEPRHQKTRQPLDDVVLWK